MASEDSSDTPQGRRRGRETGGRRRQMTTKRRLHIRRSAKRTVVATAGYNLASEFEGWFKAERVGRYAPGIRQPWLTTAGGKQAYQHLILRAVDPNEPILTIGWVNCALYSCKLRTWGCLNNMYERRFKRPLPIERRKYRDFFETLSEFFETEGFHVIVENEPPEVAPLSSRRPAAPLPKAEVQPTPKWVWVTGAAVAVLILIGILRMML